MPCFSRKDAFKNGQSRVKQMGADYIFMSDLDFVPCISARKKKLLEKYRDLNEDRVQIVVTEIEGWYYAGLDKGICEKLGVRFLPSTDAMTKEQFNGLIPNRFVSRTDYMLEILRCFSLDLGKQKNKSLGHFVQKYAPR
jgi:hypothetical protein